jgi:oligopeptide transport system substrate-binding protein
LRELPAFPILYYSSRALVSDKLKGWEDNIQDVHRPGSSRSKAERS